MKDQFVTFEIANQLKKLGFNEPCLKMILISVGVNKESGILHSPIKNDISEFTITYPLWQQAIDWFETFGIYINPIYNIVEECFEYVILQDRFPKLRIIRKPFKSKKLTIEKALLEAIEILKERQHEKTTKIL